MKKDIRLITRLKFVPSTCVNLGRWRKNTMGTQDRLTVRGTESLRHLWKMVSLWPVQFVSALKVAATQMTVSSVGRGRSHMRALQLGSLRGLDGFSEKQRCLPFVMSR